VNACMNRCKQGRSEKPCARAACRNAPPPIWVHWIEVALAALEDLFSVFRFRRRMGFGRWKSFRFAFSAAITQPKITEHL
jgi:hypothetical protein